MKQNLRRQLNNIDIEEKDGTVINLVRNMEARMKTKEEIRKCALKVRAEIGKAERRAADKEIAERLIRRISIKMHAVSTVMLLSAMKPGQQRS